MKRVLRFLQLSRRDQWLLSQALVVLAVMTLGVRTMPWATLQRLLMRVACRDARSVAGQRPSPERIAWAVKLASWYVPRATCLPRALATQMLLLQRGYPAAVQIGVTRREDGRVEAHAWVPGDDQVLIGAVSDLNQFVPLSPERDRT